MSVIKYPQKKYLDVFVPKYIVLLKKMQNLKYAGNSEIGGSEKFSSTIR